MTDAAWFGLVVMAFWIGGCLGVFLEFRHTQRTLRRLRESMGSLAESQTEYMLLLQNQNREYRAIIAKMNSEHHPTEETS